jgi:Protein of unknown function (DUF4231)
MGSAPFMGNDLPDPPDRAEAGPLVWLEFKGQFLQYSRGATNNRLAYQCAKVAAIVLAAAVTVCAALSVTAWITASLGAAVVVLEALQQLFQWQANWISYRRSAETMRQHGLAFAAGMPPYDREDRRQRLAAILQEVARSENTGWAGRMTSRSAGPQGGGAETGGPHGGGPPGGPARS